MRHTSPDGSLTLEIPTETIVRNADGTPAYLNTDYDVVGELLIVAPPVSPNSKKVVAYQFSPPGLNFSQGAATLVFNYNPANVPAGATVTWAFYNDRSGLWETMETAGYVAADTLMANTIATKIITNNFDRVAVLVR